MDTTLNKLIDELAALRGEKKRIEYDLKTVAKSIAAVEWNLIQALDDQGVTSSGNQVAKVSIRESVHPQVEDWEQFHNWILDNRCIEYLQRRASDTVYREALGLGRTVPGVVPYTKRSITFRET